MKPSIFNDVIGPVMRGPSSSHTAASFRIGSMIRQFSPVEKGQVHVEFDRNGSLATTYEGQGSAMGLIWGLLGKSILDPQIMQYKDFAQEQGLDIEFIITDFENSHPNTYKLLTESLDNQKFKFIALSTGGGMIEMKEINGFHVSLMGDFYEILICVDSPREGEVQDIVDRVAENCVISATGLHEDGKGNVLINIKSRNPVAESSLSKLSSVPSILWYRQIDPVVPVLAGNSDPLPFSSIDEMLSLAEEKGADLASMAIEYESARAGVAPQEVTKLMTDVVVQIEKSIRDGLKGTNYRDRILPSQSHLILEAQDKSTIIQTPQNMIIAYVSALMEVKSSMGIIVAAPTAGSAGVLGGAVFGATAGTSADRDSIVKAFLAAGMIGVFIAGKYTFAAEAGGCQVECGAASGMAAAALAQVMGGTARQSVDAASMALQNMLGLVCDPVADRVEVPCLGKNILGATNALNSANMSLAGFDAVVPLDETIDAMKEVGNSLPSSLCCTGLGGLSITPTSRRIHKFLNQEKG